MNLTDLDCFAGRNSSMSGFGVRKPATRRETVHKRLIPEMTFTRLLTFTDAAASARRSVGHRELWIIWLITPQVAALCFCFWIMPITTTENTRGRLL
jgi:hypothetical protein